MAVVLLPVLIVNDLGMGDPYFCKYICPQGVLEGALPLSAVNEGIRSALGKLFSWKLVVLISVVVLSVLFYRPFCKWICPLGAFYALFNKVSLFGMKVDEHKCVSCGKCAKVCKMDVDVTKTPNSTECIRCGKCISACPTDAVSFQYGFGMLGKTVDENAKIENKTNKKKQKRNYNGGIIMKFSKLSKILTVVLLVSVLAISLIACSTSKDNKDEKQSTDSSISTLMATEPSDADEALKLYNQLMKKKTKFCQQTKPFGKSIYGFKQRHSND